jgi:stage II sporulation protein D
MPSFEGFVEKRIILVVILLVIIIILIPVGIALCSPRAAPVPPSAPKEEPSETGISGGKTVDVYVVKEKKLVKMGLEDYVMRVTAGEMPATYDLEALKAQACAARTFTVRRMQGGGCGKVKGADICTDSGHCQAYKSPEDMKKNWGAEYLTKYKKVKQAVEETKGKIIVYKGEPITALYHSTSGGYTENSEDVFVSAKPYLRSVKSEGEEPYAPRFRGEVTVSNKDFAAKLRAFSGAIDVPAAAVPESVTNIKRSPTGRVLTLKVDGKQLTGRDIRKIFNLNSTNFKISYKDNKVVFDTLGYGHGVGLSQTGANAMAKKGAGYEEILKHYYSGVDIVNMK